MNKRLRTPFYLLLLVLTFLKVQQNGRVDGLLNRAVPAQYTIHVQEKTVDGTAVNNTIVPKFRIKVRYMGGDCSYALVATPVTHYTFLPPPDVVTVKYTAVLHSVFLGLRSLRGPPVLSIC